MSAEGYRRYFTDMATVYHRTVNPATKDDEFRRIVVPGVMAQYETGRSLDANGTVKAVRALSVTVLPDADPEDQMQPGDYLLVGEGPELGEGYALKDLRRDWPGLAQIQAIADNRGLAHMKHRRVECV